MMQSKLPQWLQQNDAVELPKYKRTWSFTDYLEKTLRNISEILSEDTESIIISNYNGMLQRVEAHVKLIGTMALIIAVALTKSIIFLMSLNILILGVALQSGIRLKAFGIRVWVPTLLFTGIAVLPGIMNWVTPGKAIYTIYTGVDWNSGWFSLPTDLTITKQGVQAALFVILRSAASLGLATLIMKTTRWALVLKVLAKLGLSTTIVTILDLTYRYIYLFLLLLMEYLMGRKSRLVGVETQSAKISWIGGTISDFLRIIKEYSQDINYAMQSRGYSGDHYPELNIEVQAIDICFFIVVTILCYYAYGGINDVQIFSI
jgi:cobalt/nickel transport system permease protein